MKLIIFTGQQQCLWQDWLSKCLEQQESIFVDRGGAAVVRWLEKKAVSQKEVSTTIVYIDDFIELDSLIPVDTSDYYVVGFYSDPVLTLLSELRENLVQAESLSLSFESFQQDAESLLSFCVKCVDHVGLYHLPKCQSDPEEFWMRLQRYSDVELKYVSCVPVVGIRPQGLSELLIRQIQYLSPSLELVYEQLEAASENSSCQESVAAIDEDYSLVEESLKDFQLFHIERQELKSSKIEIESLLVKNELSLLQLQQVQQELEFKHNSSESLKVDHEALQKKIKALSEQVQYEQARSQELTSLLEVERHVSKEGSNNSLLQIQQLQEELEAIFSEAEKSKTDHSSLVGEYQNYTEQVATEQKKLSETLLRLKDENQSLQGEKALAIVQIEKLQEELEATFSYVENVKQSNVSLSRESQALSEKIDEEQQGLRKIISELESDNQFLNDEHEISILQIQQLQEELGALFDKSQDEPLWEAMKDSLSSDMSHIGDCLSLIKAIKDECGGLITDE